MTNLRPVYWLLAAAAIAFSLLLPEGWYHALDKPDGTAAFPVTGIQLLKFSFMLEAAILAYFALRYTGYRRIADDSRCPVPAANDHGDDISARTGGLILLGLTVLGAALRLYGVNSDLWLDEIATLDYAAQPLLEQWAVYLSPNNHTLNSVLIKVSIALFGEHEWSIRLTAVLFGIASVPVFYLLCRFALNRWQSLLATAMLVVFYHHIFFTQNARGYSAYLFLSLLSTVLFLNALRSDRLRTWVWYVCVTVLNFSALLNALYVLAAHAVTGLAALYLVHRSGASPWPLCRRLFWVFGISALLVFQFYAVRVPQIAAVITSVYSVGPSDLTGALRLFVRELISGMSAGFGPGLLLGVVPFMLVTILGFLHLARRNILLLLALLLPALITAAHLIIKGLSFSPRFFLFQIFLAIIAAIAGLFMIAGRISAWRAGSDTRTGHTLASAMALVLILAAAGSLLRYYTVPKQSYRAAIEALDTLRQAGQPVIVFHLAAAGIHYYSARLPGTENRDYTYTRSRDAFEAIVGNTTSGDIYAVTTLHRFLYLEFPGISKELQNNWERVRVLPATIGDGQIIIWRRTAPG